MAKKGFQTSGELMEAVRALDYKAQYKVYEAFYKLSKGFDWGDRLMFQRFEESFGNGGTGTCSATIGVG